MSPVILTAKGAKTANKKGSASGSLSSTLRKVCRKGSALNPGQQECFLSLSPILPPVVAQNLRKFVLVCFSMFASFALFAVHDSKPECSLKISPRKARKPRTKKGVSLGSLSSTLRKVCRKGSALNPGQQECFLSLSPILPPVVAQNLRKFVLVCFSMFASFALFAVHVSKRECPLEFRAVRVVRGLCF